MEATSSLSWGSFLYKISKFTLADKRDIFFVQELLKRRLHRWARLIRRQPGLEGLETQHEKKMTEISKSGISPTLSFSNISYANHQSEVRAVVTHPQSTGAPLHAYFFMVMSTSGCCLAIFPG